MNTEGWLWFALVLSWAMAPALYNWGYNRGFRRAIAEIKKMLGREEE